MKPQIGITDKHLHKSIEVLSVLLADEMILYVKTRKFHWNVYGESFMELHKLFQAQYSQLELTIDEIAERINKLGGHAIGTMKEFVALTRLEEKENLYPAQKEMIKVLLSDHESITTEIRKDIEEHLTKNKDAGTLDFLTGIMEQHETTAWILRRYLK